MEQQGDSSRARAFAASFTELVAWAQRSAPPPDRGEAVTLVREALGDAGLAQSVVTREFAPFEQVNLQTALNSWSGEPGRRVTVHGVTVPPHFDPPTLQQLSGGEALPPLQLGAPALVDLPNGPGSTLACLQLAVIVVRDGRGRYVLLVQGPAEYQQGLRVQVAGLPVQDAQRVLGELDRLRDRLNVYRGHWLDVSTDDMGSITLGFVTEPGPARDQVILPEAVLSRMERHTVGVARHRERLAAAGQHLKRGMLLFGPPGTGKTYSTRYLLGRMEGTTRLTLTGRSLHAIGSVTELARTLQPSVVVLEDVDLVAEDRDFGPGTSSVLFDLLDAMDGAAGDADLTFLLTTNRVHSLERALAARPGRVDVAVEIALPDEDARARLLDLYGRPVPLRLSDSEIRQVVQRTDGVTASFLKELVRRSVLEALEADPGSDKAVEVTGRHVLAALDELQAGTSSVTRALLGASGSEETDDQQDPDDGSAPASAARAAGWFAYGPRGRRGMPARYRSR